MMNCNTDVERVTSEWDFFTAPDPTHGNVDYVSREEAISSGLASVGNDTVVVMAVDDKNNVPIGGNRKSYASFTNTETTTYTIFRVRISTRKKYTGGLFIMDANAMPSVLLLPSFSPSANDIHSTGCATWPAFWTVTPENWPTNGEIDIVEGVNNDSRNQMTLHTRDGCLLDAGAAPSRGRKQAFTGKVLSTTCNAFANSNSGCGVASTREKSFGAGIESQGGAVFAMLWDQVGIRVWNFPRSEVPGDLDAGTPNPSTWPVPDAFWSTTTCPVDEFFSEHVIVINTTLCGYVYPSFLARLFHSRSFSDFAGALYPSSGCPATCAEHVADPNNFKDAKWKINYVAVYN